MIFQLYKKYIFTATKTPGMLLSLKAIGAFPVECKFAADIKRTLEKLVRKLTLSLPLSLVHEPTHRGKPLNRPLAWQ